MRLPNGYGSVYKLSGKRRNPYIARITKGWTEEGKQIKSIVGYYPTKTAALQALADYNNAPYDLDASKITFSAAYEKWHSQSFDENTNRSTLKNYSAAFKYCESIYDMRLADIRLVHLQECVDAAPGHQTATRIRILLRQIYRWGIKNDCVKKDYSEGLEVRHEKITNTRSSFSSKEIDLLWKNCESQEYIKLILMLIYSGVRINELLDLKKEDVHLEERWFKVRASKTDSGIRDVPIAEKVVPFWEHFLKKSNCTYAVCTTEGEKLTYDNFKRRYWNPLLENLGMKHTPHEARHTCISLLTTKNTNPTFIKIIVGHKSIMDLTERVYTHIEMKDLIAAINQI